MTLTDLHDLTASAAKCLHFLALHHSSQNSWNEEITPLSTRALNVDVAILTVLLLTRRYVYDY